MSRIGKAETGDGDRPKLPLCVRKVTESISRPAAAGAAGGVGAGGGGGAAAGGAGGGGGGKGGAGGGSGKVPKGEIGEVRQAGDGSGDGWVRTSTGWK